MFFLHLNSSTLLGCFSEILLSPLPGYRTGAGGMAGVYFLKCPLMKVPERMTGCEREMEGERARMRREMREK